MWIGGLPPQPPASQLGPCSSMFAFLLSFKWMESTNIFKISKEHEEMDHVCFLCAQPVSVQHIYVVLMNKQKDLNNQRHSSFLGLNQPVWGGIFRTVKARLHSFSTLQMGLICHENAMTFPEYSRVLSCLLHHSVLYSLTQGPDVWTVPSSCGADI